MPLSDDRLNDDRQDCEAHTVQSMQLTFVVDDALNTGRRKRSAKACDRCKAKKVCQYPSGKRDSRLISRLRNAARIPQPGRRRPPSIKDALA